MAGDQHDGHGGGGGGDGDGSLGAATQLSGIGGAAVGHKDVVITTITGQEVKMVECQPDSTV